MILQIMQSFMTGQHQMYLNQAKHFDGKVLSEANNWHVKIYTDPSILSPPMEPWKSGLIFQVVLK